MDVQCQRYEQKAYIRQLADRIWDEKIAEQWRIVMGKKRQEKSMEGGNKQEENNGSIEKYLKKNLLHSSGTVFNSLKYLLGSWRIQSWRWCSTYVLLISFGEAAYFAFRIFKGT